MCVLSPHAGIAIEEDRSNVGLSPHAGIAIEEEKSNVGFEPPCGYCN
jgi:hypothetical protein